MNTIKTSIRILLFISVTSLMAQKQLTPSDRNYTGEIAHKDFVQTPDSTWFVPKYENYAPATKTLRKIKRRIKRYSIKVFMGTWCPDSRRETPKIVKLLDEVGFPMEQLTIYAMDRRKTTAKEYEKGLDIHYVPTIIFFDKDGNEVNRIVENTQKSLEEDVLDIVSGKPYKNIYAE